MLTVAVVLGPVSTGGLPGVQLLAGGPGMVAYAAEGTSFPMYVSATGRGWARLPGPTFRRGEMARQLFIVGQRFIIAGFSGSGPRIWASANGGRAWQESPAHLEIRGMLPGGRGLIALVNAGLSTQLWTSANGVRWQQLRVANRTIASASVFSVARGGPGYIAGGVIKPPGSAPPRTTIWTSQHGLTWTEVPNAATIFAGGFGGITQVVAGPAGAAAVGTTSSSRNAIWASRDGIHWRRAADNFITTGSLLSLPLAVWKGGFADVQDAGTGAELYSSPDGVGWTRRGSDNLFGGSAWVTAMIGFHGGLAAIGGFASHPIPACLSAPGAAKGGLVSPTPTTFFWIPQASQTASAPKLDTRDPRVLRLLPQDFPSGYLFPPGPHNYLGQYVNLCGSLPALGRHRAYLAQFGYAGVRGLALDVVTQDAATAGVALGQVDRLIGNLPWVTKVQHVTEIQGVAPIGDATRVFTLGVKDIECGDLARTVGVLGDRDCRTVHYSASAVVWRHGRVIGMVVTDQGRSFAMELARKLLVRSEHPSD